MIGCTFKPKINKKSKTVRKRTVKDLMNWKCSNEKKKSKMRLEKETSERRLVSIGKRKSRRGGSLVKVEDRLLSFQKIKKEKIGKMREVRIKEQLGKSKLYPKDKNTGRKIPKMDNKSKKRKQIDSGTFLELEEKKIRLPSSRSKKSGTHFFNNTPKIEKNIKKEEEGNVKLDTPLSFKSRFDELVSSKVEKFCKLEFEFDKEFEKKNNKIEGFSFDPGCDKSIEIEILNDSDIDTSSSDSQEEEISLEYSKETLSKGVEILSPDKMISFWNGKK